MRVAPTAARRGRDIHEAHRVSTPLELLFDLTFAVAIAQAAAQLHHVVTSEAPGLALVQFATAFWAIWWAWMNYSWFASAYDNDDTWFRLLTLVQMVGVLIFATGVPLIFEGDFRIGVLGYAVMRLALVVQWLRAGLGDPPTRRTCFRYALGIFAVQLLWVSRLTMPPAWQWPSFALFFMLEQAVPPWAEACTPTPWHAHHIAERYGAFTIIVLGECVLGAANAVGGVLLANGPSLELAAVGLGSAALLMGLWWVYFLLPSGETLHHHRERSYLWGYGHYFIFASVAATGAGLQLVADLLRPVSEHTLPAFTVLSFVAGALGVYLSALWFLWWRLTRLRRHEIGVLLLSLGALVGVVAGVAGGLSAAWALPGLALAPVVMIVGHRFFSARPARAAA